MKVGAIGIVCALALSACGTSSGSSTGSDAKAEMTKADFIAASDAICARFTERMTDEVAVSGEELTTALLNQGLPLMREQLDKLRELDPPASDRDEIENVWDEIEAVTDPMENRLRSDPEAYMLEPADDFEHARASLEAYGMTACSEIGE